jgi:OmpA-OmpF porin, OOP family
VKLKAGGKVAVLIIILAALFGAYRMISGGGGFGSLIPSAKVVESSKPISVNIPSFDPKTTPVNVKDITLPSGGQYTGGGDQVRWLLWAWNAHMGLMFANGGPQTTTSSLMAKNNVNLSLTRQDDAMKMQESLVEFATVLSQGNAQPNRGSHFVSIMGDGAAAFLAGLNDQLKKIGPEYTAKVVGVIGFSRGEDKFMGPKTWKANPGLSKGGVVSGYLRDGDWNIALKWLGDNGLKNNPDEKTYDPDALNWVAANDYVDAAEKYITGYTEERDVVKNGKKTGQKKKIKVDGVVTWTPGDVAVASKKGGVVSIVSTKEYSAQMPCVVIGIDKWCRNNPEKVEGMLTAIFSGGDAVRSSGEALRKAAEISQEVYQEKNADASYWERYFKGSTEKDATGEMVELGGSSVVNLYDNLLYFGMAPGSANIYQAVYKVFGDLVVQQYPDLVPTYPDYGSVVDTTYINNIQKKLNIDMTAVRSTNEGVAPKVTSKSSSGSTISKRNWDIKFASGRASFTGTAEGELKKLLNDLLVAGNTYVEIHGHTDNVGNADANMKLSESRAFAVKKWLESRASKQFPAGRVRVIAHGQTQPLVPNGSEYGKSVNRRVEIKIKTSE